MLNGLKAVQDLALLLTKKQRIKVFKFEKFVNFSGEYIVVNHLPFTYGKTVNASNVLNVNIHTPVLSSGNADLVRLNEILSSICNLIPFEAEQEEVTGLPIDGSYYSITSVSQPIEDRDNTYFLNVRVKVITNQLIM